MCTCDQGHMKKMRVCLIYNYIKCLCVWLYWMCIWYHVQVEDMGDNSCIWSLKEMLWGSVSPKWFSDGVKCQGT